MRAVTTAIATATLVIASGTLAAAIDKDDTSLVSVLSTQDIEATTLTSVADVLAQLPNLDTSYRFGDNPDGKPTLPADLVPAATPDRAGAVSILPGDEGWTDFAAAFSAEAWMHASVGDGLVDGNEYIWFFSTRDEKALAGVNATDYYAQIDFVIGFDGLDGWMPLPQYPGDTWQGGSLVASALWTPEMPFNFTLVDTANEFATVDFDGAFYLGEDWTAAAIDAKTLYGYGSGINWGFASHVHDGTYGDCGRCESIVTAYPKPPRDATALYSISPQFTLGVAPAPTETAAPAADGTGGGFPWWILIVIVAVIAVVFFLGKRNSTPIPDACKNEKAALDAAKRETSSRQTLVSNAKKFLTDREAFAKGIRDQRAEIATAKRGPRGGTGGNEFARIGGRLIKYADLLDLDKTLAADLKNADAEVKSASADLTVREKAVAAAKATEATAKKAFDACMSANGGAALPPAPTPPRGTAPTPK